MSIRRYEISNEQWNQIKDMFPRAKTGRPPKDNRIMFNAILWLAQSGVAWADIPERYGPHQTVYSRFCKWRDDGTLLCIFRVLNEDADFENLSIDSTSIKASPQSASAKKGAVNSENNQFIGVSKGDKTTKIYAVVDGLENPVHFILTGGDVHDSKQAIPLLSELNIYNNNILADRAYGAKDIRNYIDSQGAKYTISPKTNTKEPWDYDYWLYKERHRAAFK